MRRLAAVFAIGALVGCGGSGDGWMPLRSKNHWSYTVTAGLTAAVRDVRVAEETPVGDDMGWHLVGAMGDSHLAWVGGTLYAGRLAGTDYAPPIPVCRPAAASPITWTGGVHHLGKVIGAKARLAMEEGSEEIAGRKLPVWIATLTVTLPDRTVETITSYAEGIGIVRQEERHDGALIRKIRYVSGP